MPSQRWPATWWWPTSTPNSGLPEGQTRADRRRRGCTGEPLTASDDWEWGLINRVVKEGSVVEAALTWPCG